MNIRAKLNKLEGVAGTRKNASEMTDEELENFIANQLRFPQGAPITDDMLQSIINEGKAKLMATERKRV